MTDRQTILRLAVSGVLAVAGTAFASATLAADSHSNEEQCAGIIKAGKNDCATASNECHSHVTVDASADAWIYVPKGTCERLVGGRVVMARDPTPAK